MAAIDVSGGGGAGTNLTQDIYVNNINQGSVDYQSPIYVDLQSSGGTVIPNSILKFGNSIAIDLPTPVAAGAALQRSTTTQYISYRTGDIGWRTQNNWFNYTPPLYPAKYAELDYTAGANCFYTLKTPLTVNGVTSTERFVDASGIQSWSALNNLNLSVVDKLTGLMFTRRQITGTFSWQNSIDNALLYSANINGVIYSDWYLMSINEFSLFFGSFAGPNWTDPTTGQIILPFQNLDAFFISDTINRPFNDFAYRATINQNTELICSSSPKATSANIAIYIHDASNLIS